MNQTKKEKDRNNMEYWITKWSFLGLLLSSMMSFLLYNNGVLVVSNIITGNHYGIHDTTVSSGTTSTSITKKEKTLTLERGTHISDLVTPEELYNAYKAVRDDFYEKAFECYHENDNQNQKQSQQQSQQQQTQNKNKNKCTTTERWKTLKHTEDGIDVSIMQHPSDPSCPYVRMSATVPTSMEDVWEFLRIEHWNTTMPQMDPFYEGMDIRQQYLYHPKASKKKFTLKHSPPIEMILARKRYHRLGTFGKRDFAFVQVSDHPLDKDGMMISGTISVVTDKLPRMKGYTRAFQNYVAFYEPQHTNVGKEDNEDAKDEPTTKVTVMGRIDLNDSEDGGSGGSIPMWLYVKTVGRTGVYFCRSMRKQLERLKQENINGVIDFTKMSRKKQRLSKRPSFFSKLLTKQ